MPEPSTSTSSLVAAATIFFGSAVAGEYAAIILASLTGSLWALSDVKTESRTQAAWFVVRMVLTATMLTGSAAWWIEQNASIPATHLLSPIALIIAALGNRWRAIIGAIGARVGRRLGGTEEKKEQQ